MGIVEWRVMPRKLTTEEWVARAISRHGDRYSYAEVEYRTGREKVRITCHDHGVFEQGPTDHTQGKGCPRCAGNLRDDNESFIAKAKETHGERYDYSRVDYVNSPTKVDIVCEEHGVFRQTSTKHIGGQGCPECGVIQSGLSKRTTFDEWVSRAISRHGDRYGYSEVEYNTTHEKIRITCHEHGVFEQTPSSHLQGNGCPGCSGNRRDDNESFIAKAKETHGERYDYSRVDYVNSPTKVDIVCEEHGVFRQTPTNHISGQGCPDCGVIEKGLKRRLNSNEVIERANKIHNNRYDYSKFDYVGMLTSSIIICSVHGDFSQGMGSHIFQGAGCMKCAIISRTEKMRMDGIELARRFVTIHEDRYDYSLVDFSKVSLKDRIEIFCTEHGVFGQRASDHLAGNGCQECAKATTAEKLRLNENQLMEKFVEVHGEKYDYSLADYEGLRGSVIKLQIKIICPEHGVFEQRVSDHLAGNGCTECGKIALAEKFRLDKSELIRRFTVVHGSNYDYSLVQYQNMKNRIKIICPEHGVFEQSPEVHLNGSGCSKCTKKNQNRLFDFVCSILPDYEAHFDYKHPDLRFEDSGRKMELDIWLPELALAFEYQGEQHYARSWVGVMDTSDYEYIRGRDSQKRTACIALGIRLIEIPYTWDRTEDYVVQKMLEAGLRSA